jgi:photosystem II stability/assembly factor-like uncharacterized protein
VLLRSDDGGRSWSETALAVAPEAMVFTSPDAGAVVGENKVLATTDAGRTWQTADVPTAGRFRAVSAVGGFLWAAGDLGAVVRVAP